MNRRQKGTATGLLLAALVAGSMAPVVHAEGNAFEVYGFAQADYIQDFMRVDPQWAATMRASKIPTNKGQFGSDGQAIISVRQSRLGAKGNLATDHGDVFGRVEFDFFGTGADAGQTTIRLRHAYGEWNHFLAGQTESLFMDSDLWPNIVDYWGPAGMVFLRNPQLRYSVPMGADLFAIALEHPNNDVDPGVLRQDDSNLGANVQPDMKLPDLTLQFRNKSDWGHVQIAGILRRLGYDTANTPDNAPKGKATGYGVDATSVIKTTGKDKIFLSGVFGRGIANYMNDGGMDLAAETNGLTGVQPAAVPLFGLMAYYDHWWSDKWSSSAGYGRTQVENTDLQEASAFHSGEYASCNLLYYPVQNMFVGTEYLWGMRRDSGGAKGIDNRLQFSVNYKFSSGNLLSRT